MNNFWKKLKKPVFLLAPMEDVTDTVFRRIIVDCGPADVMFTEFTNADGICSEKGSSHVTQRLKFTETERPLVAQIWGTNPDTFFKAAQKIQEMGFDGLDINMGCPERNVVKKGAGGGCIQNPERARELIKAAKEGAPDLPVSVKTRIGFKEIETEKWVEFLLKQDIVALTLHLRTVKEMSEPPAHWDEIAKAVNLRNKMNSKTLIFGNGDIKSLKQAKEMTEKYKIDGVMIATGIFHNPWIFNERINIENVSVKERLELLGKHVRLWDEAWGNHKNFQTLKKYFKIYVQGFDGAHEARAKLMTADNPTSVYEILKSKLQ